MPAVFYVWGLKQAFILQNVSEAQLDQYIWEPAQEDADNIWISKALHTKICLNTEEKYNTETPNLKIKNIKLKWQDSESFFFFLYCILCLLPQMLCSKRNGEWQYAEDPQGGPTLCRRGSEGSARKVLHRREGRLLQKPVFWTTNIPVKQSPRNRQPLLFLLLDYLFYNSSKINYKRV